MLVDVVGAKPHLPKPHLAAGSLRLLITKQHDLGVTPWCVRAALQVADMVQARVEAGKNYGVILIPEGLIEQVQDVRALISGEAAWA